MIYGKSMMALALGASLAGTVIVSTVSAFARSDIALAGHRAVYDLELHRATSRSGISGSVGRMVLELTGSACEGWKVDLRLVNRFSLPRNKTRLVDSRSSSWESTDGLVMRYSLRQYVDNRLEDQSLVKAVAGRNGKPGTGETTKPEKKKFTIPLGAVFPVQHQKRLITAALENRGRDASLVYDGSDKSKSFQAISFIGSARTWPLKSPKLAGSGTSLIAGKRFWKVTISYYSPNNSAGEETPKQQISFDMFANGVSGNLIIDYGEFALKGRLIRIDKTPAPKPCD